MTERVGEYWFPAKRYGWGWGLPRMWQGWLVLGGYVAAVMLISKFFSPGETPIIYFSGMFLCSAVLIAICWLKGEPPRWQWGGRKLE